MAGTITLAAGAQVIPSATKNPTTQNYVGGVLDIHKPQVYSQLVARYGNQSLQSLISVLGNFVPVAGQTFEHYEDDFIHSSFTASIADAPDGTANSVAALTFTIAAGFVGDGATFVRTGDVVKVINAAGTEQTAYVTATPAANTFTIVPYGVEWNFAAANADDAVQLRFIVIGREAVGISQTPEDTLTPRVYKYTNNVMKIEDAAIIEGGEFTNMVWFETVGANGKKGWTWALKTEGDTDMRFENYAELMMLLGEKKNAASTNNPSLGTEGLIQGIKSRGNTLDLNGGAMAMADMDTMIKQLNKYKGSKHNALYAGIDLRAAIDDAIGGVNAYVSGERNFGTFSDNLASKGIRIEFDYFERLGYKFMLNTYDLFNHPELLGATGFNYSGSGMVVPLGSGKEAKTGDNKPYISVRYKSLDGYSRLSEKWVTGGARGVYTDDKDRVKFNYRTERGLELFMPNKFVWIEK